MVADTNTTTFSLPRASYLAIFYYLITLVPIAVIGNSLVIVVFLHKKLYRRPVNWFIFNLAVADLTTALLGYPMLAISAFQQRWIFYSGGCHADAFICYTCSCNNIMTYAAIAYYRYAIMCKYRFVAKIKARRIITTLVCIWSYSLFWTVTPYLGWNSYALEQYDIACSIRWYGQTISDRSYVWACFVFVFVVPLGIMIFSYIKIESQAKRLSTKWKVTALPKDNKSRYLFDLERHTTRICLIMSTIFVLTWSPYAIMSIITALGYTFTSPVSLLPMFFAKSSCSYNPIVYCLSHSAFRRLLTELFCYKKHNRIAIENEAPELLGINKGEYSNAVQMCSRGINPWMESESKMGKMEIEESMQPHDTSSIFVVGSVSSRTNIESFSTEPPLEFIK